MKTLVSKVLLVMGLLASAPATFSQCEIHNRIYADGTVLHYIDPVNFYWTRSKELKGGVVTDMENFYLQLQPSPCPAKPLGNKLKDDLELKLANDSVYRLPHFDTRYLNHDTVMQLLYLIEGEALADLEKADIISVKINMKGTEGIRTYVFKLHKSAVKEQLDCFRKEKEKKKNRNSGTH